MVSSLNEATAPMTRIMFAKKNYRYFIPPYILLAADIPYLLVAYIPVSRFFFYH